MRNGYLRAVTSFATNAGVFPIRWTLGDFVRKLREGRGWTQQELADRADLHKSAIVRLEADGEKSERVTIARVAKALEISEADLYAHVEHANLFSKLSEVQRLHLVDFEKRLLDQRQPVADPAPNATPPNDHQDSKRESDAPIQKRQQK